MKPAPVNLVVALPAEAQPIVAGLGLKRLQPERGFPIYRGGNRHLVVSSPGKVAAAAATALLNAVSGFPERAIWLNLGIAGHSHYPLGEGLLASRITDAGNGCSWHPATADLPAMAAEELLTVDRPDVDYRCPGLIDMEAAGFYPTACRFTHPKLVHCLKIVSDNATHPARDINAHSVSQWMQGQQQTLGRLIETLSEFRDSM